MRSPTSTSVYTTIDDTRGDIWFTCALGIGRLRRSELDEVAAGRRKSLEDVRIFDHADGLRSIETSLVGQPGAWRTGDSVGLEA